MGILDALNLKPSRAMGGPSPGPGLRETAAAAPPVSVEAGFGDDGIGSKETPDGASFTVKHERKHTAGRLPFKIGLVPMFLKLDLKASAEGEISFGKQDSDAVAVKAGGNLMLAQGMSVEELTVTLLDGSIDLSASIAVKATRGSDGKPHLEPVTLDVIGVGKVGARFEVKDAEAVAVEVDVQQWQLYHVDLGEFAGNAWKSMKVRNGRDLERLIAGLRAAGPKIEQAVEVLAPPLVKKLAELGAQWVAESDAANRLAEKTDQILQDYKREHGIDFRPAIESLVRDLCDAGGETSQEATERVQREAEAFVASHEGFHAVMEASGLNGELRSRTKEDVAEYNAIVDVWAKEAEAVAKGGSAPEAWRAMVEALVAKRRAAKAERERQAADRKKAEDEAKAADLARRVRDAEARMNAAWQAAVGPGNTINNSPTATEGTQARKLWQAGMLQYYNKGVQAKQQVGSLQGEARIAKADEATALFVGAAKVFREGVARLG